MLDINKIIENPQAISEKLAKKGCTVDFAELIEWSSERKKIIAEVELMKAEKNKVSAEIPKLKKEGKDVTPIFERMRALGDKVTELDEKLKETETKIFDFVSRLPNVPDDDLLGGEKENNRVISVFGSKPEFDFEAKNHVDICNSLGIIDYERGTKLAGGGYWLYRGDGARLEWALLNFFISEHLADGYEFILPPHMLGYNCGFGAGQFPKFADEVYWVDNESGDNKRAHFMLPTAETALVNMFAGEIKDESKLPMKFIAYTPCYTPTPPTAKKLSKSWLKRLARLWKNSDCISAFPNSRRATARLRWQELTTSKYGSPLWASTKKSARFRTPTIIRRAATTPDTATA